jgi:hypothetical protein
MSITNLISTIEAVFKAKTKIFGEEASFLAELISNNQTCGRASLNLRH